MTQRPCSDEERIRQALHDHQQSNIPISDHDLGLLQDIFPSLLRGTQTQRPGNQNQRPSPDKELIKQVLHDRQRSNISNPIADHESSLLVNSPGQEQSVGRMNQSFSRTKIAASLPHSEKNIMDDAKKQLFMEQEDEEDFLVGKHHTLLQALSEQQHELKRLETKQRELIQLKEQAEERLADANESAARTIQAVSNDGTPKKMHSKYNMREIPHEIEQVKEGNLSLVEYDESDNEEDIEEFEPLTLDSNQFDVLQKKLADLNKRQKDLEQKSKNNQNIANNSFKQVNISSEQEEEEEKEAGYEKTGHATETDYEELCGKVEELRERKQYMDQLLSYYSLLKDSNSESKELIDDKSVLTKSQEQFGEPSERDRELLDNINSFQARAQPTEEELNYLNKQRESHNKQGHNNKDHKKKQKKKKDPTKQKEKPIVIEEINTPGVEAVIIEEYTDARHGDQGLDSFINQGLRDKQELEEKIRRQKENEEQKMSGIQAMRDQLSRIQVEMGTMSFNDTDSHEDISSKLAGLENTRNRVKELRERLSLFEESDVEKAAVPAPASDEEKLQALLRAQEKLKHLHMLASKVKEARAGGQGIPAEVLNEISLIVPKDQESAEEDDESIAEESEEIEEQNTSTDERLSALLRRKLELETVQNELKQLRDQQKLLSNMEQTNGIEGSRVVPECDRELLWESLREKQAAQLDRLKKSEPKYDGDSNDGFTTRATWGGSSIRSVETADLMAAERDDIEGGQYPDKTIDSEEEKEGDTKEARDARLLYEIETNYWIEHCKQLSKQLAERTHTIHVLLGDKPARRSQATEDHVDGKPELYARIEQLTVENDALHSELNEVYGMDAFQDGVPGKRRAGNHGDRAGNHGDSEFSTPNEKSRAYHERSYADKTYSNYSGYSGYSTPYSPNPHRNFRKPVTPSAFPQYPMGPWHSHYNPYMPPPPPPPPHPSYYYPYHHPREFTPHSEYSASPGAGGHFGGMYPPSQPDQYHYPDPSHHTGPHGSRWPFFPSFYEPSFYETPPTDPNSPFVTRAEEKKSEKQKNGEQNKNSKNVSFSLSQIKTSGDTISTQYPTPRKHEAYKKLAESSNTTPKEDDVIRVDDDVISVSSTDSSVSLQIVDEVEGDPEEKGTGRSAFEGLQNTVYSEVASLISANETRPHYLIELVRELSGLENDYLRQRHLYMLRDLRGSFLNNSQQEGQSDKKNPGSAAATWLKENNWSLFSASEATPSNNSIISDVDNEYEREASKIKDAEYDYLESVENLSSVSTSNSHPFASESLGSTAINLSSDLADVRRREEMEKRLEDVVQEVISKYGVRRSESSSAADNTSECEDTSEIESSFSLLEQEVKRVMIQVIPLLRDHMSEPLSSAIQLNIAATIIRSTASVFDNDQISENFASNLTGAMKKYEGDSVQDCAHNIIVDLSEVLFQDVNASHIIVDEDEESVEEESGDEEELVLENGHTPTPQDIRARFLASTGVGYDESDDPELEYSDTVGNEVECAVSNTQDEEDDEEEELMIVEEDEPVQPRFSETGELFSDGGDMSDIVELPVTEDESNDDVPVKELSSDNILTVEDLPCRLNIPGVVPSYRDAVVGSSPLATPLLPTDSGVGDKPENAAANGPDNLDTQAVLEVIGESTLAGNGNTIIPPP
ncbi:pericentriolar material 1 protein-like isoform X7 [Bolinopsis microptera]|uniref:pericentriolar material 1 protein-like isoform X7 n=1 Tax=Bolinopsis microptera TaxID=2820187 RepID=UPI00307A7C5E